MEEDHAFDIYNDDLDPSASAKEDSNKEREVNIAGGGLTGGGLEDDLFIDFGEIERVSTTCVTLTINHNRRL